MLLPCVCTRPRQEGFRDPRSRFGPPRRQDQAMSDGPGAGTPTGGSQSGSPVRGAGSVSASILTGLPASLGSPEPGGMQPPDGEGGASLGIGSGFDFMNSSLDTGLTDVVEDEGSAFSFLAGPPPLPSKSEGAEPPQSSLFGVSDSGQDISASGFDFMLGSAASSTLPAEPSGGDPLNAALALGGEGEDGPSGFSFIRQLSDGRDTEASSQAAQGMGAKDEDKGAAQEASGFSFLLTSTAIPDTTGPLPTAPPPKPFSASSSSSSMDRIGEIEALLSMSPSTSTSSPPVPPQRVTSATFLDLSMPVAPAPAPTPTGPITFERTATSKVGIRKKKTSVKVGYARDEPEPPPPPLPPAPLPPLPSLSTSMGPSSPSPVSLPLSIINAPTPSLLRFSSSSSTDPPPALVQAASAPPPRALSSPSAPSPAPLDTSDSKKKATHASSSSSSSSSSGGGGFFSSLFGRRDPPPDPKPSVPREAPPARAFPAALRHAHEASAATHSHSRSNSQTSSPSPSDAPSPPAQPPGAPKPKSPPGARSPPGPYSRSSSSSSPSSSSSSSRPVVPPLALKSNALARSPASVDSTDSPRKPPVPTQSPAKSVSRFVKRPSSTQAGATGQADLTMHGVTPAQPPPPPRTPVTQVLSPASPGSKDPVGANKASVESLVRGFQKDATDLCFRQQDMRRRQAKLVTEKEALLKQELSFGEELRKYEGEQQRLAEMEEFDRAEALQHVIDQVRQQTVRVSQGLQDMSTEATALEAKRQAAASQQTALLTSTAEKLRDFLGARGGELEAFLLHASTTLEAERKRLAAEEERIVMELSNVDKDEAAIREEFEKLDTAMCSQTSDLQSQRAELDTQAALVQEEVEALEAQLQAKRAELARLQGEQAANEGEISKVCAKFERPLTRLREKERVLGSSRRDVEGERAVLEQQRQAHELAASAMRAEEGRIKALVEQVALELQVAQLLADTFHTQAGVSGETEAKEAEAGSTSTVLEELQAAASEAESRYRALEAEHGGLQVSVVSLREEVEGIDRSLPLLEQAKKDAAAARNYKDAGARSKEIKTLQARREEAEAELGVAKARLEQMQEALEERRQDLHECVARRQEKERESEGQRVGVVSARLRGLRRAKRELGRLRGARIETSAELLLQAQLEALQEERAAMATRVGIAIPEDDEEEEQQEQEQDEKDKPRVVPPAVDEASGSEVQQPPPKDADPVVSPVAVSVEEEDPEVVSEAAAQEGGGEEEGEGAHAKGPITAEAVAQARELQVQIIALEDRLAAAVAEEDYEAADELNANIEDRRTALAALGPIDVVHLIMGDDEEDEEEGEEEVVLRLTEEEEEEGGRGGEVEGALDKKVTRSRDGRQEGAPPASTADEQDSP